MPHATISKSELKGSVLPPPSLELAYRWLWAAAIGEGGAIGNMPNHPDIKNLIHLCEQLGADIKFEKNIADIFGAQIPNQPDTLICYDSQRASRLALPLALTFDEITTLKKTNIPTPALAWLDEAAAQMEVRITKMQSEVSVLGPPKNQWIELHDRQGAFWLPGFMLALPLSSNDSMLSLDDYTAMHSSLQYTLETYRTFDIDYAYDSKSRVLTIPGLQRYPSRYIDVPSSWKEASYYLGAYILSGTGEVIVSEHSHQPEKEFWLIFHVNNSIAVSGDGNTHYALSDLPLSLPKTIDPRPYPALIPLIILLATQAKSEVQIGPLYPMSPLAKKRADLMVFELRKIGAKIEKSGSNLVVSPSFLNGGNVTSHNDSRIAMALCLAGLICKKPLHIENIQAVNKTNKNFLSDLKRMGAKINY